MATLFVYIGLPASGKSTHAKEIASSIDQRRVVVSSDAIRAELWGSEEDQRNPAKVFELMFKRTVDLLKEDIDVIYDATNLVAKRRKALINQVSKAVPDTRFVAVFFACTIEECKARQHQRDRKVPDEVIDRMVQQFETPWYNEGWDKICVISRGPLYDVDEELIKLVDLPHDNPHHERSVGQHCIITGTNMIQMLLEEEWVLDGDEMGVVAATYHDIGKGYTKSFRNRKGETTNIAHYYNHNNVGAYMWLSGNGRLAFDWENDFLFIGVLIQWHMQPYFLKDQTLEEWCRKKGFDEMIAYWLGLIHKADKSAH